MGHSEIQLYYKNVTAEIVGEKHGITPEQVKALAEKTSPLILKVNEEAEKLLIETCRLIQKYLNRLKN